MTKFPIPLLAAAALLAPAAASAATPNVAIDATTGHVVYRGGPSDNSLNASMLLSLPVTYRFFESAQVITPGAGCSAVHGVVDCHPATGATTEIFVGGGDDYVDTSAFLYSRTEVNGGPGNDRLRASGESSEAHGADGDDIVVTSTNTGAEGYGGDGDDLLIGRGTSSGLSGNAGDDFLIPNVAHGLTGAAGGPGADTIIQANEPGGTISGGADDDLIGFIAGGGLTPGGSTITGNGGNDRIYGSVGIDTISGGAGDDLVATYGDGQADTVDCNGGTDVAYVDAIDTVAHCETVVIGAPPTDPDLDAATATASADAGAALGDLTLP